MTRQRVNRILQLGRKRICLVHTHRGGQMFRTIERPKQKKLLFLEKDGEWKVSDHRKAYSFGFNATRI